MDALRARLPSVQTDRIVGWIPGGAGAETAVIATPDASVLRRRIRGDGRAVRFRQDHPPQPAGRTDPPFTGEGVDRRPGDIGTSGQGAGESTAFADRIVFQSYNLLPVLTAAENAEFTMLQGVPAGERRERVRRLFAEIGLEGLEDRKPPKLSGGQQQRVAVARAVLAEPALVLADEPTANLDSAMAEALLDVMEKLNREKGTTFVFSTHDPRVMERAGRLIRLVDGRVEG